MTTHSRMMQSLATCFLSTLPSPPPPPLRFSWPPLGLFIIPDYFSRMDEQRHGGWVTRAPGLPPPLSPDLHLCCCRGVVRRAHLVGLYSWGWKKGPRHCLGPSIPMAAYCWCLPVHILKSWKWEAADRVVKTNISALSLPARYSPPKALKKNHEKGHSIANTCTPAYLQNLKSKLE